MSVLENFRWPSLARDLAVMQTPGSPITDFGDIYETYGITEDGKAVPVFRNGGFVI